MKQFYSKILVVLLGTASFANMSFADTYYNTYNTYNTYNYTTKTSPVVKKPIVRRFVPKAPVNPLPPSNIPYYPSHNVSLTLADNIFNNIISQSMFYQNTAIDTSLFQLFPSTQTKINTIHTNYFSNYSTLAPFNTEALYRNWVYNNGYASYNTPKPYSIQPQKVINYIKNTYFYNIYSTTEYTDFVSKLNTYSNCGNDGYYYSNRYYNESYADYNRRICSNAFNNAQDSVNKLISLVHNTVSYNNVAIKSFLDTVQSQYRNYGLDNYSWYQQGTYSSKVQSYEDYLNYYYPKFLNNYY